MSQQKKKIAEGMGANKKEYVSKPNRPKRGFAAVVLNHQIVLESGTSEITLWDNIIPIWSHISES